MRRLPASERTRQDILNLLEEGIESKGDLFRQGVQRIIEEMLEAKVEEMLKQVYYAHREDNSPKGYRNGYREGRVKTGEGEVHFAMPQVRDIDSLPSLRAREARNERGE